MNILVKINSFMRHEEYEDSYEDSHNLVVIVSTPALTSIPLIRGVSAAEANLITNVLMEIKNEDDLYNLYTITNGMIENELLYLILDVGVSEAVSIMLSDEYERFCWNKNLQDEIDEISELVLNSFANESDDILCDKLYEIIVSFVGPYELGINIRKSLEFINNCGSKYNNPRQELIRRCIKNAQNNQQRFEKKRLESEFVLDKHLFNSPSSESQEVYGVNWGFEDADPEAWYRYSINISPIVFNEFGSVVLLKE